MKVSNRTVWKDDDGSDLLSKDDDGKFYIHVGFVTEGVLIQLREAITQAIAKKEVAK